MRRLSILLTALVVTSLFPSAVPVSAAAPTASTEACRAVFLDELTLRRDEERAALFGSRKALSGDSSSQATVLTGGKDSKERKGIFETKERLTSELIEPLVQSYRTLRCKMEAVCTNVKISTTSKENNVKVHLLGCEEETLPRYNLCFIAIGDPADEENEGVQDDAMNQQGLIEECNKIVHDSLAVEREIIKMSVAYDAGYRSLLQFAGMMDWMMEDLPTKVIRPIRDMVNMLGKLHQIPCFIGQCDEPDTSNFTP